jgi:hypothetical protein
MNSNRTRLVAGTSSAIVLSAPLALALVPSLILTNFTGTLRIHQGVPCGGVVDVTTSVAGGRMDITPSLVRGDVIGAGVPFNLTRLVLFYTPFSVHHACNGISATAEFHEIGVRLASAVKFTGQAIGERRYSFSIPREQFLIYESVLDNLPVQQPETSYHRPSEAVTGVIDLGRGTSELHIVLASRMRFRAGCVRKRCIIDEVWNGTQTTDISGIILVPGTDTDDDGVPDLIDNCPLVANPTRSPVPTPVLTPPPDVTLNSCQDHNIGTAQARDVCNARPVFITNNAPAKFAVGPNLVTWSGNDGIDPIVTARQTVTINAVDRTPPTVSCTAVHPPPGRGFQVSAVDDCGGRLTHQLGAFTLDEGEVIQMNETGRPGVRLIGTIGGNIRHFQVGKGEGVIRATDAAGNVARATCR